MGRKRRLLAARGKFGNKFSAHPRYAGTQTQTTTETTQQKVEDVAIIAEQVETIAQEVVATEEETNEVISNITPTTTTITKAKAKTKTTKTRRTRKTIKK